MMTIELSRRLAIAGGLILPVVETLRRRHELTDVSVLPFWIDDWIIAGFLLHGAWRTRAGTRGGRSSLAAAWAFACGMAYSSFFSQLYALSEPDPSGLQSVTVVTIKGVAFAVTIVALVSVLKSRAVDT